jgi:hypothetical protein
MKSLLQQNRGLRFLISLLILIVGTVTLVVALNNPEKITEVICILWAVFCFILGLMTIVSELIVNPRSPFLTNLISGAVVIGVGIFLCFKETASILSIIVSNALPWILIAIGATLLIKGFVLIAHHGRGYSIAVTIIGGALCLTLGIVFWIARDDFDKFIYTAAGSILIAWGVYVLVTSIVLLTRKKEKVIAEIKQIK